MMRKIILGLSLVAIVFTGIGLSTLGADSVLAQEILYSTPEQAFLAVLGDYMTITRDTAAWRLGEIEQSSRYAYTIAQAGENVDDYHGFVMLLARQGESGEWTAVAPEVVGNAEYNQLLAEMPDELIGTFGKFYYYLYDETPSSLFSNRSIPLHHFPWPIRREAILTQKDGSYHTNQLDFVMRSTDDIYASKPGIVIFVKDSSSVGGCDMDLWPWANFVVIQHTASEFSWYVHLKYGSATVNVGDLIGYGTKIGEQGNTGFACGSTGIHLHYMASSEIPSGWPDPNVPNYAPWPPSGSIYPIDFIESSYAALVEDEYYVSQNASPPGECSLTPLQVGFFDNTYCNSNLYSVNAATFVDLDSLGAGARLESIEIPDGWSAALYLDQNELGGKTCLNQSDSMLWDDLFDNGERVANNVIWARLYQVADCPYPFEQGIALYPDPNFVGIPLWGMVGERSSNAPGYPVGSVYVPDGHSAVIYDQDNQAGNSVCLTGSALDLSAVSGWPGGPVESVYLVHGDSCESVPNPVPQPILIKPINQGVLFQESPELCWQMPESGYDFNVHIFNDTYQETSDWIGETCWSPPGLTGLTGTFFWRVQARNDEEVIGNWSATYEFTLAEDSNPPVAEFLNLEEGGTVVRPRTFLTVSAADGETSVTRVHFFAWYDDGSEAGYDWHYLGVDEDSSDGWQVVWNLTSVVSTDAAVWASAEDVGGNSGSVFLSALTVSYSLPNDDGYEARENGGTDGGVEPTAPQEAVSEVPEDNSSEEVSGSESHPPEESSETVENKPKPVEEVVIPVVMPNAPAVVSPVFNETYLQPDSVELCWEASSPVNGLKYQVEVSGANQLVSPWMASTCWKPDLEAISGEYTWRVKTRKLEVGDSGWSAMGAFQLISDETAPLVEFIKPVSGAAVSEEVLIQLSASDYGSGLRRILLMAWYDAGSGAEWHEIGDIEPDSSKSEMQWNIAWIAPQRVQLWVYVEDQSGNLGSAVVPEIFINTEEPNPSGAPEYPKALKDAFIISRGEE
jgi:murein DD-endopeptidase MepM/ murein hydrolase activator NlpD